MLLASILDKNSVRLILLNASFRFKSSTADPVFVDDTFPDLEDDEDDRARLEIPADRNDTIEARDFRFCELLDSDIVSAAG